MSHIKDAVSGKKPAAQAAETATEVQTPTQTTTATQKVTLDSKKDVYRDLLVRLKDAMVDDANTCKRICALNSEVSRSGMTDDILIKERRDTTTKKIDDNRDLCEYAIRRLNNPPKDFERAYNKLVELYGIYNQIVSQAVGPSGSLISYNMEVDKLFNDFTTASSEFNVLVP
jgi:hypothetical protein